MNEDQTRNRYGNSTYDLAILRHMALNLIQRDHPKYPCAANSTWLLGRTSF